MDLTCDCQLRRSLCARAGCSASTGATCAWEHQRAIWHVSERLTRGSRLEAAALCSTLAQVRSTFGSKPVKPSVILALVQLPDRLACSACVNTSMPHAGADPWTRHTASQCPVTFGSISWSGTQASPALFENILPCCQLQMVDLLCILQMTSL